MCLMGRDKFLCYIQPLPICRSSASPHPVVQSKICLTGALWFEPRHVRLIGVTHSVVSCSRMFRRRHHSLLSCQLSALGPKAGMRQTSIFVFLGQVPAPLRHRDSWGAEANENRDEIMRKAKRCEEFVTKTQPSASSITPPDTMRSLL